MAAELLQQMHDIAGLDPISCWPFAIGWWLIITGGFAATAASIYLYCRRKAYRQSWKYLVYLNLENLTQALLKQEKKYIITELSETLRQIAVQKYPREDCAGITGEKWLHWLDTHDPKKFQWSKHGKLLALGPYARSLDNISNAEIEQLINAAKRWVQ